MSQSWEDILNSAQSTTDKEFASQISSLTHMTDDEINKLAPANIDRENLAKLLKVVSDSTLNNNQKADAIRNTTGLLEIAIPLINKFI